MTLAIRHTDVQGNQVDAALEARLGPLRPPSRS
jgi:hypothetical protein